MAGRGVGRGAGVPALYSSPQIPGPAMRRIRPGPGPVSSVTAAATQLSISTSAPRGGKRGDSDPNRPTYRVPDRFKNRSLDTTTRSLAAHKQGSGGRSVRLTTNYFSMREYIHETYTLAMHKVEFEPDVKSKGERHDLVSRMRQFSDDGYFYDGRRNLFIATPRQSQKGIGMGPYKETFKRKHGLQNVLVTFIKEIGDPKDILELDMAHGVINQHLAKVLIQMGLIRIGEGFYDEKAAKEVVGLQGFYTKLNVWPGYKPLLMQYDAGLLLNVDVSNKFVRTGTVYDLVVRVTPRFEVDAEKHCIALMAALKGTNVLTIYSKKCYKIKDITCKKTADDTFERRKVTATADEYIVTKSTYTIGAYLKEMYGVDMKFKGKQPMLMCEAVSPDEPPMFHYDDAGKKIFDHVPLIPEFCMLVGLTDDLRSNQRNMNLILDSVRKEPHKRYGNTKDFAVNFNKNPAAVESLQRWAIEMGQDLQTVDGRELKTVALEQKQRMISYDRSDPDWTRSIRSGKLDDGQQANKVVIAYSQPHEGKAREFYTMLQKVAQPMGMILETADPIPVNESASGSFRDALQKAVQKDTDLAIAVLPDNKKDRYDLLKQEMCRVKGVPSQCVLLKNVDAKGAMSIATKIALQINAKLKGALWHIQNPAVKAPGTMVVGVASATKGKGTVMTFVGTTNTGFSRFASFADTAGTLVDRGRVYGEAFTDLFAEYKKQTGRVPLNVIIYRLLDGEEFMYDVTNPDDGEHAGVRKMLRSDGSGSVKMLFCVALKRCSTRFFTDKFTNVAAGTVVDTVVTQPGRFDFFLISHNGRKGTAMPTYYFVVGDETGITSDELQNFTFQMSHMYYNWSGTIKVPAVCQYALKMVVMMTEVLIGSANESLKQSLWFL